METKKISLFKIDKKRKNEIIGVLFIALALLIFTSLLFSVINNPILPSGGLSEKEWLTNILEKNAEKTGVVGYYLAFYLRFLFGYTIFILPILIFLLGYYKFRNDFLFLKIIGSVGFLFSVATFLSLIKINNLNFISFALGGKIGVFLSKKVFYYYFGRIGAYIIILSFLTLSFLLTTNFLLVDFFHSFKKNLLHKFIPLIKTIKDNFCFKIKKIFFKKKSSKIFSQSIQPKIILSQAISHEKKIPLEESEKTLQEESAKTLKDPLMEKEKYEFPPLSLLEEFTIGKGEPEEELLNRAKQLIETLKNFGIEARINAINRGPVVTRYEIQPAPGIKVVKITTLASDIALAFAASQIRIEAPIPGKSAIGIEIPNKKKDIVHLKEILTSTIFKENKSFLKIALGKDIAGTPIITDLKELPHLLIAGATGSGKSVCINSIICSFFFNVSPEKVKFVLIDPKRVELSIYNDIPYLITPVVKDAKIAAKVLDKCVEEMEKRYKLLADAGVRNIENYNKNIERENKAKNGQIPYLVIIIDELADLMMISAKEVENKICRLAQMARGVGIHLILATQRPTVNVITGLIKANIPSRLSFAVSSQIDSRTILDMNGAETLLGAGDMLFLPLGEPKPLRIQGTFLSEKEIKRILGFIKRHNSPSYWWEIEEKDLERKLLERQKDELYEEAVELVIKNKQASVSWLQRKLGLGYSRAAKLIDEMESAGIVSPQEGSKPREVLVDESFLK